MVQCHDTKDLKLKVYCLFFAEDQHIDGNMRLYKLDSDPSEKRDGSLTGTPHMPRSRTEYEHRRHVTPTRQSSLPRETEVEEAYHQQQYAPPPPAAYRSPSHTPSPQHSMSPARVKSSPHHSISSMNDSRSNHDSNNPSLRDNSRHSLSSSHHSRSPSHSSREVGNATVTEYM